MAVIGFSGDATDVVSFRKAVFRMILTRAKSRLTDPADVEELNLSQAMEGISFELLDDDQRARLVEAVYAGTAALKHDIEIGRPLEEPVRPGIENTLEEILALIGRFRK